MCWKQRCLSPVTVPWVHSFHHQGCDFPLIHREILPVGCSPSHYQQASHTPFISWFLSFFFLYFLHNILSLCKWWNFCTVTGLSSPVGWQSSDAATSSSSHIVFVSPRLLLSNLKMSMPAVSISQSHLWKAWVHIYKWHFMYDGKGLQWKK